MRALISYAKKISVGYADKNILIENLSQFMTQSAENSCAVFLSIEEGDTVDDCIQLSKTIQSSAINMKTDSIFLLPFSHLSPFSNNSIIAVKSFFSVIKDILVKNNYRVILIEPNSKNILLTEFILFDGNGLSHLRMSHNSIKNELNSLKKIFGKQLLLKLLSEE